MTLHHSIFLSATSADPLLDGCGGAEQGAGGSVEQSLADGGQATSEGSKDSADTGTQQAVPPEAGCTDPKGCTDNQPEPPTR